MRTYDAKCWQDPCAQVDHDLNSLTCGIRTTFLNASNEIKVRSQYPQRLPRDPQRLPRSNPNATMAASRNNLAETKNILSRCRNALGEDAD
jgi:hypothetical protein